MAVASLPNGIGNSRKPFTTAGTINFLFQIIFSYCIIIHGHPSSSSLLFLSAKSSSSSIPSSGSTSGIGGISESSIHRFSNKYGTILRCQNYLTNTPARSIMVTGIGRIHGIGKHHSNDNSNSNSNSNNLLIPFIDNGLERDLQSILDQETSAKNITYEWQIRYRHGEPYQKVFDHPGLRYLNRHDGSMALAPFNFDAYTTEIHDAWYRCLVRLPQATGTIASREVMLQAVVERPASSSSSGYNNNQRPIDGRRPSSSDPDTIRIRVLNSTEIYEGNDAILKCEFDRHRYGLWHVSAWFRDDGKIYLPLEQLVNSVRRSLATPNANLLHYVNYSTIRHFVLPNTGDLLISRVQYRDAKHRYRCQIRHKLTNYRQYSAQWGHILFKKSSENYGSYNSGPRLNPQLPARHTIVVNEGQSAFFYCSFDGHPAPLNVEWYHTDLKSLNTAVNHPHRNHRPSFAQSDSSDGSPAPSEPRPISRQSGNFLSGQYLWGRNFLAIERVTVDDTGVIACVANTSNSIVRHEMLLLVRNFLHVSLHATTNTNTNGLIGSPYPGQDVTLSCNLSASANGAFNFPSASASGSANGQLSGSSSTDPEYRFRELISSHFMLNINWYHNGLPINFDHRKRRSAEELLLIRDFRGPDDNGIYQCSVRLTGPDYDEESFMAAIHINSIEKPPEFVDVFGEQIKQTDGPKREHLSLKCSAFGVPLPHIRWMLDGQELYTNGHIRIESYSETYPITNGGVPGGNFRSLMISHLNISMMHPKDIGMYECIAENYLGTIVHRARVNQLGPPFVKMIQNQTAVQGRPYTMNCTYGGYPLEEVYFVKGRKSQQAKRMPFDERHLVPMLGSITITTVEKSDQDFYRCIVVTSNGAKSEQEFYLHVAIPPVISPIIFSDNFEEGKRGSAVCTVTSGDPPIHVRWFKDGEPLDSDNGNHVVPQQKSGGTSGGGGHVRHSNMNHQVHIVPINDFMSSLTISNISRHHEGTYTCVARSPIAITNVSAYLSVRAAPIWLLKSPDIISVIGQSLTLDCQTTGQPPPVIRWKFLKNEPYRNEPIPILSSQQVHVLENGSLHLRALELKDSGIYICDASNDVGKHPIEWRTVVTVTTLPKVQIQNTLGVQSAGLTKSASYRGNVGNLDRLVLRKGSQTQLMCSVMGVEQPMVAEWLRPNIGSTETGLDTGSNDPSGRIVLREETKMNEKRAYLYINHVTRIDTGVYTCIGTNTNGHSMAFIEMIVQEPPDTPVRFHATEIGSRSITLAWQLEFNGNSPITTYMVEYWIKKFNRPSDDDGNIIIDDDEHKTMTGKSLSTTLTITGLMPSTTYEFRVCAINEIGASPFTIPPLVITTEMEAPSLIPLDLRTLVLGSRSIKLIWSIVLTGMGPSSSSSGIIGGIGVTGLETSMMPTTTMMEQIDGFYIGYRPVLASSTTSATSSSSSSSGGGTVTVSAPIDIPPPMMNNGGGVGQSSSLMMVSNGAAAGMMMDPSTAAAAANKPGNHQGKIAPYTFKTMYIRDPDGQDSGSWPRNSSIKNQSSSTKTFCEVIPRSGTPESSGNKKQQPWNRKSMATSSKGSKEQIRCTYEFLVGSLQRKTRYGFIVQAFNSKGAGPVSQEVYAQTLLKDPPGKPAVKLANVSLYEATIVWSMPSVPASSAESIMSFENDQSDFDQPELFVDPPSPSIDHRPNIEGYIISYRALIKRSVPLYGMEDSPGYLDDHLGGQDIDSDQEMALGRNRYIANNWETVSVSDTHYSHTLRNLRCGTLYQIRVEAFNEMGSGEPSDVLQFSTLGQAPNLPNSNGFILPNITTVMLDLDRWSGTANGQQQQLCPILNFAIRYRIKDTKLDGTERSPPWITVASHLKPDFTGAMYLIRELLPGTWYELSIIAVNDAGETEARYLFATLTIDGGTVEPLYAATDHLYNRRHLGVIGSGVVGDNIFEDPMILIPATCAILVLLVIGAATVFIFITRSKEALSRTEHFCRHRESSRSDQLSLNIFSKSNNTYTKSDLIRSYGSGGIASGEGVDPHKLTQIETLNCGGATSEMIDSAAAAVMVGQYVDGPQSLTFLSETKTDGSGATTSTTTTSGNGIDTTPSRRSKATSYHAHHHPKVESFYSTPCIAGTTTGGTATGAGPVVHPMAYCTMGKSLKTTGGAGGIQQKSATELYGDLNSGANPGSGSSVHHAYYTHQQFLNHDGGSGNNKKSDKPPSADSSHIYELPKQASAASAFDQTDANFVILMMQQQQQQQQQLGNVRGPATSTTGTGQSPHRLRANEHGTGNFCTFQQNF